MAGGFLAFWWKFLRVFFAELRREEDQRRARDLT
jgi:hypothetical protein